MTPYLRYVKIDIPYFKYPRDPDKILRAVCIVFISNMAGVGGVRRKGGEFCRDRHVISSVIQVSPTQRD